jgi:2-polyprenyl-3-methyl-5-hydroxy-6-metoxy-1,4-benzoquinol methylase
MPIGKFQCVECQARLIGAPETAVMCERCGTAVTVVGGILDFLQGPTGPVSDPDDYDALHHIDDARSLARYRGLKRLAGQYWPSSLGSVLEVGCGTGLLTRALIREGEATDLVVTDIYRPMVNATRGHLDRAGLLAAIPLTFATHGGTEPVFRDAVFDTCIGGSVLHYMPDVRQFLANMFRWLKPGGRAFFTGPNVRYHRALGQTLADILILLSRADPAPSDDRQALLNLIAQWRRGILHQGDLPFLTTLEDKHMFASDSFEAMARELGFKEVAVIPASAQPTGTDFVGALCRQIGVGDAVRAQVMALLPAFKDRYLSLLSSRDQSDNFLFWLEKGTGPVLRHFHGPAGPENVPPASREAVFLAGGLPPRWVFELMASRVADGIALRVSGWCLVNTDVLWVRVTLGDVSRAAAVWLPRPDVPPAIDPQSVYASWNALCCGVDDTLLFPDGPLDLRIEIVLASGGILAVAASAHVTLDEPMTVTQ